MPDGSRSFDLDRSIRTTLKRYVSDINSFSRSGNSRLKPNSHVGNTRPFRQQFNELLDATPRFGIDEKETFENFLTRYEIFWDRLRSVIKSTVLSQKKDQLSDWRDMFLDHVDKMREACDQIVEKFRGRITLVLE